MSDQIIAAIRTGCAALGTLIVTALVGLLTGWGLPVEADPTWSVALAGLLFAVAVGLYNLAVNWLAKRWPAVGLVLGVKKTPEYVAPRRQG